jgi:hypothetical protein
MKRIVLLTVTSLVLFLGIASIATADVPNLMQYQGYLADESGEPLNDTLLMTFRIYDHSTEGVVIWVEPHDSVVVNNGLFNVLLGSVIPISDSVFVDTVRWLGITVDPDPEISPRTKLVTVPYAFRVATVDGATGGVILGDVAIQSDLDVDGDLRVTGKATIGMFNTNTGSGAFVAGEWNTASGNNSTVGGGVENTASGMMSVVSGGGLNSAGEEAYSTVGGGYADTASGERSTVSGGVQNTASGEGSTVGGGERNFADSTYATVGGGYADTASGWRSTVSGGAYNKASNSGSVVGGGWGNVASGYASTIGGGLGHAASSTGSTVGGGNYNVAGAEYSTVAGGHFNIANGYESTVGGGYYDTASGHGSTVCGGSSNHANGTYSAIGGGIGNSNASDRSAIPGGSYDTLTSNANWSMAFGNGVYLDSQYRVVFFDSVYSGRLGINRDDHNAGGIVYPIHVGTSTSNGNGAYLTAGGTWTNGSSRTFKENFQPLHSLDLLSKISSLPVNAWQYKGSDERHIGPVSEDFVQAFDVGTVRNGLRDNKYLSPGDVAGVALAGVKELILRNQKLTQQNQELREILEELKQRITELEKAKQKL